MRRPLVLAAVVSALLGAAATSDDDVLGSRLAAAVREYDAASEKARDGLLAELKRRADACQKAGDLRGLERVEAEAKAFRDNGDLPKAVPTTTYESEVRRARAKLEEVYKATVAGYTKAGQLEQAKAAREQFDEFKLGGGNAIYKVVAGAGAPARLQNNNPAFSNRPYQWADLPGDFPLTGYAPVAGHDKKPVKLNVTKAGWVFVALSEPDAVDAADALKKTGWERTALRFSYTDKGHTKVAVLRRKFPVGEVELPRVGWSGPTPLFP